MKDRIVDALIAMGEMYGKQLSDAHLALFCEAVSDLPPSEVATALQALARTSKFFPLPADVREFITGTAADRALAAWTRVERAMDVAGPYASVSFDDPVIHATIMQLGGWPTMCDAVRLDERDYSFKRREFLQTYELFAKRGHGAPMTSLPGLAQLHNDRTRGTWARGLGHVDEVLAIGAHGEVKETRVLPTAERKELPGHE